MWTQRSGNSGIAARWLTLVVLIVMIGLLAEQGTAQESDGSQEAADRTESRPVDEVPGFGLSPEGVARDDLIALHEVRLRERAVQSCMESGGFTYTPEMLYADDSILAAAELVTLRPTSSGVEAVNAAEENHRQRSELSPRDLDAYWITLNGATAAEIAGFEVDGEIPASWEDNPDGFLRGGCIGDAAAEVPGIWALRRELMPSYAQARAGITAHPAFEPYAARFSACIELHTEFTARTIAELEELRISNEVPRAGLECEPIWGEGILGAEAVAMQEWRDANEPALAEQQRRYDGAVEQIGEDDEFMEWLSAYVTAR